MVEGRRVFGEEGNMLPSTSSMITGLEMLPAMKTVEDGNVDGEGTFFLMVMSSRRNNKATVDP
jgi:hypothetical protein